MWPFLLAKESFLLGLLFGIFVAFDLFLFPCPVVQTIPGVMSACPTPGGPEHPCSRLLTPPLIVWPQAKLSSRHLVGRPKYYSNKRRTTLKRQGRTSGHWLHCTYTLICMPLNQGVLWSKRQWVIPWQWHNSRMQVLSQYVSGCAKTYGIYSAYIQPIDKSYP